MKWSDIKDKPREIDMLIADKVMDGGWSPNKKNVCRTCVYENNPIHDRPDWGCAWSAKLYSTDIAAAWEVVEKMGNDSIGYLTLEYHNDKTSATFCQALEDWWVVEPTAPLTICHAALLAVGAIEE